MYNRTCKIIKANPHKDGAGLPKGTDTMQIRKKTLRLAGLALLGICGLTAAVLCIYLIFFYEKALPEPTYTSMINSSISSQQLTEITVHSSTSGQTYTFHDKPEMEEILSNLQAVKLYRETESDASSMTDGYEITVTFYDDIAVEYYLSDGYCTDSNGTMYECADTAFSFLDGIDQQVAEERYDRIDGTRMGSAK